ncbi:MAG: DUF4168 domain-containing protein [Gloeomargarita sp. SKYBB_i_bin120]|nr:DUF4168 domain-containing protein [Gloeomargarita sp. SKYG98]MCS7292139.1 DUF4168 domain-containing protein [Gloeomargarita sp. SKYB120]MDW8177700.1 DUF4168 domain-containing protein [Gloeomargarita sp. SKYBB_i_bin120]
MHRSLTLTLLLAGLSLSRPVVAQSTWSDERIQRYAQIVLELEPIRQAHLEEARRLLGTINTSGNLCAERNLPAPVRNVCDRFFEKSQRLVEQRGLTVQEFNAITMQAQQDPNLSKRIQDAMLRQRKPF